LDDFGYIKSHLFDFKEGESLFQLYRHIFDDIFYHNFSKKQLNNFIIDYFHLCKNKKLFLILRSFSKHDDAANFLATLTESIVENFEINLICNISEALSKTSYQIQIPDNLKINSIYFIIGERYLNKKLLILMKYYILFISFKFGIKKIIFDESFSTYNINDNDNDITNLGALVNYYKNDSFNLDIEEIIIEKENIYSLYQRIYLKYHLKRIFSKKAMCDVIIITFEELKNIIQLKEKEINNLKDKLNHFEYDKNNFKTLIIDFKGNSPYQQNFIYFCHNFIGYNESFNKIALFNMGKKTLI